MSSDVSTFPTDLVVQFDEEMTRMENGTDDAAEKRVLIPSG